MKRFAGLIDYNKVTHRSFLVLNGYSYKFERLGSNSTIIYTHTEAKNNKSTIQTFYINTVESHVYTIESSANGTTVADNTQNTVSYGTKVFLYYE